MNLTNHISLSLFPSIENCLPGGSPACFASLRRAAAKLDALVAFMAELAPAGVGEV